MSLVNVASANNRWEQVASKTITDITVQSWFRTDMITFLMERIYSGQVSQ